MGAKQSVDAPEPTGEAKGSGAESASKARDISVEAAAGGAPDIPAPAADAAAAPAGVVGGAEEATSKPAEQSTPVVAEASPPADGTAVAPASAKKDAAAAAAAATATATVAAADDPLATPAPEPVVGVAKETAEFVAKGVPEAEAVSAPEAVPVQAVPADVNAPASARVAPADGAGVPTPTQPEGPAVSSEAPASDSQLAGLASAEDASKDSKEGKVRTLEQMMSLKPGDDERTEISKKLSWILRHGAKKVNVEIDAEGWVKVSDLLATDILSGVSRERLLEVIDNSNSQKVRYELNDDEDGLVIRATSKNQRREERADRPARAERTDRVDRGERRDRRREGEADADRPERVDRMERGDRRERVEREAEPNPEQAPQAEPRRYPQASEGRPRTADEKGDRPMKGRSKGSGDRGGWWERDQAGGPTFEQQIADGFRPVYQGERVVAMVKDQQTVHPGRKGNGPYADQRGKGGHDGKGKGKPDKGYGKGHKGNAENGGDAEDGEGWKGGKGYGGRGMGYRDDQPPRPRHWRVAPGEDAIVRESDMMESAIVGTLLAGTLVAQIGEDKVLKNGIVRMMVEAIEPQAGIKGWATRSAEAAGGPVFFKPDRSARDRGMGRGGRGGKGLPKGGGRRPGGKGEGPGKGDYNVE